MNLLLFASDEIRDSHFNVDDRRAEHLRSVLKVQIGDRVRVGLIGGKIGQAEIVELEGASVRLRIVELSEEPPVETPMALVIALPRPKSLPRLLQNIASMGVKSVYFVNAYKVEKFFWSSDYLSEEVVRKNLLLGLEQSVDTVLPQVEFVRRLKPFVEDKLPKLAAGRRALLAHPYAEEECPFQVNEPTLVAVGPEGGWIDYEIEMLTQIGFQPVSIGPRILRLENAVTALIARLNPQI